MGGNLKKPKKKLVMREIITKGQAATVNGVIMVFNLRASYIVSDKIARKKAKLES
jgi:hypothetical protein